MTNPTITEHAGALRRGGEPSRAVQGVSLPNRPSLFMLCTFSGLRAIIIGLTRAPGLRFVASQSLDTRGGDALSPGGSRLPGNPSRRRGRYYRFYCRSCGWTGKRGANLIYCPRCGEQSVYREDPPSRR
jgi:hypothetical protein